MEVFLCWFVTYSISSLYLRINSYSCGVAIPFFEIVMQLTQDLGISKTQDSSSSSFKSNNNFSFKIKSSFSISESLPVSLVN